MHKHGDMTAARQIVQRLKEEHGFRSDRALAAAAGLRQPTLARFLKGDSQTMEVENFFALAQLFGVTLSELLGEVPIGGSQVAREVNRLLSSMDGDEQERMLRIVRALRDRD